MNHVISGYEPTGPGEIALGAFTLAMNDNDANWIQFIANLAIHEAGLVQHGAIMPKDSTLARPGATDLLGEALRRGAECTADFSQADFPVANAIDEKPTSGWAIYPEVGKPHQVIFEPEKPIARFPVCHFEPCP
jgi:hypothetical protein